MIDPKWIGQIEETDIAIIGMAAQYPEASNLCEFWKNISSGRYCAKKLGIKELQTRGVPQEFIQNPRFVGLAAEPPGILEFDHEFFGLSPKEAKIMDPQHRRFIQAAWHALEDAAYPPSQIPGNLGIYAGAGHHHYFIKNLLADPKLLDEAGFFWLRHTGNVPFVLA